MILPVLCSFLPSLGSSEQSTLPLQQAACVERPLYAQQAPAEIMQLAVGSVTLGNNEPYDSTAGGRKDNFGTPLSGQRNPPGQALSGKCFNFCMLAAMACMLVLASIS